MDRRLLETAGIDPTLPAAQAAAMLVRRQPLRWCSTAGPRHPDAVVESGWFAGPAECVRVLGRLFRAGAARGAAFGSAWPYLEAAGVVVAPAVPVAAEAVEQQGPDGAYQVAGGALVREAVGERRAMLSFSGEIPGRHSRVFDLLWFGDCERYLVRDGALEVEDLFSKLTLPATRQRIEQLLIRGRRTEPEVLEGVRLAERDGPASMEVRRPVELLSEDAWRNPTVLLERRADIRRLERRGDEIVAETELGKDVLFRVAEEAHRWRVFVWEGDYPLRSIALTERDGWLELSATLDRGIDPLGAGMRGRLAFDLRSDLVALGTATGKG